jgi:[ribosomal protein S5]-alanine N-acetyltransferase
MNDLEAFHAILSDARAMRYWSTPPHRTLDQSRAWLQSMIDVPADEGDDWVIEFQGRAVGKAGLWRFPEIGFMLDPAIWGRGFAREALRPVLARAFDQHGLPWVEADVDPRNAASLSLLASLGFAETGRAKRTLLVGDEWCDSVYLRLTPDRLR